MAGVTLVPLGWVVWSTAQLGLGEAVDFLARPRVGELLWNTVRLLVATVALSAVLGVGCAWLVERSGLPGHGPVARPDGGAAGGTGVRERLRLGLHHPRGAELPGRRAWWSASPTTRSSTCRPSPRCVASTRVWRRSPPRSAAGRGASSSGSCCPPISPAVLGGCLLVGLHLLGEYGALQLLNYPTLTTSILDQYRVHLQRPGGRAAGGRARRVLPGAGRARAATPRVAVAAPAWVPALPRTGAAASRSAVAGPGRCSPGCPRVALLALAVPLGSLVRWMVRGTSTVVPRRRPRRRPPCPRSVWRWPRACSRRWPPLPLAWLAVRHRGWPAMLARAQHLPRQLAARDRRRARPRDRDRSGSVPALYQTAARARGRLRDPVPAPCGRLAAVHPRAGAAGPRGRRPQPRLQQPGDGAAGDPAARAARGRVRRRPRRASRPRPS